MRTNESKASTSAGLWAALWALVAVEFVLLGVRASSGSVLDIDIRLMVHARDLPDAIEPWLRLANRLGDPRPFLMLTLVIAALLAVRLRILEATLTLLAVVPCIAQFAIKQVFEAPPPTVGPLPDTFGFPTFSYPSGHVVAVAVLCGLVFLFARRLVPFGLLVLPLRVACLAMALLIGIGCLWVGAHWPGDVLGGYLLTLLFLIPVYLLYRSAPAPDPAAIEALPQDALLPALETAD